MAVVRKQLNGKGTKGRFLVAMKGFAKDLNREEKGGK